MITNHEGQDPRDEGADARVPQQRVSRIVWPGLLAAALLVVTLLVGVLAGIGAERLWLRPQRREGPSHRAGFDRRGGLLDERRHVLRQRFTEQLHLTPIQTHQIDSIMASQDIAFSALQRETRLRFDALIRSTHQKIDSVLTPDQRALHDSLMPHRAGPGVRWLPGLKGRQRLPSAGGTSTLSGETAE